MFNFIHLIVKLPSSTNCIVFQIAECGAIPILVKMLQNAKGDEERLNACNTLWSLAFNEDNRKEINNDDYAIFELKKLLTSENSQIKRAAAGALWECEGKEKYAEEKQQSVTVQHDTGAHACTQHMTLSSDSNLS